MAFRGRGRGRGGFGRSDFNFAVQKPFELFPEIELPDKNNVPEEKGLAVSNFKFRNFFRSSPYHLDETCSGEETVDIERYSDLVNPKNRSGRESLSGCGFLKLEPGYFPLELIRGLKKLDFLEELEKKHENEDTEGKKRKEGEGESDDEEEEEVDQEEEEEIESDDDYAKGEYCDDDEDDFNIVDDGDGDDETIM
ncbi:tRNA uridine 5-carboxymethylaminomethyl modification enzyme MnmG [Bienertia sinuspersici]